MAFLGGGLDADEKEEFGDGAFLISNGLLVGSFLVSFAVDGSVVWDS